MQGRSPREGGSMDCWGLGRDLERDPVPLPGGPRYFSFLLLASTLLILRFSWLISARAVLISL